MSEQILSQEEIDALLVAMADGEVDLEKDKKEEVEVINYDLTTQSIMLRDQFYALEEVYDKFSNLLPELLSSSFHKPVDVEFVSTEMVKYSEFIQGFSNPTSFHIFNMDPLIGSALLAIEPNLVFSLIDCMFGGDGKPLTQERDFTLIEQRMMIKFAEKVLKSLEKAWSIIYSVKNSLKRTESKPEFVHIVAPNDLVMVIVFSINGHEFSGNFHLCISYLMLEPIKDKLSSKYLRDKYLEHTWDSQIQNLLKDTEVTIIAELGRTTHTIRDLLAFQVDNVLKLDIGPQDLITINVEDVPKFKGLPGIVKGNRAVEITKVLHKKGGANNDEYDRRK